jgi:hypothetical protein
MYYKERGSLKTALQSTPESALQTALESGLKSGLKSVATHKVLYESHWTLCQMQENWFLQ